MIIDANMLSDAQAVTATAASANIYDLGQSGFRPGNPLFLCSRVNVTATAGGSATLVVALETSDDITFQTDVETLYATSAIAVVNLVENTHLFMLDIGAMKLLKYVRGYYTVATGPLLSGKFDLYLSGAIDMH